MNGVGVLDELRAAAFGATPGAPVRIPVGAGHRERWLAAVALGGQGRYAAAAALLEALRADASTPPAVLAHAAVTAAAHRRQLGGHARALAGDGFALRTATAARGRRDDPDADGTDLAAARVDALVGLAADAVGLGRPLAARRLLDSAESSSCDHPSQRMRVRIGWVRAELALLCGEPSAAVAPAAEAVRLARAYGSARHLVKSLIVHVVAGVSAGVTGPDEGVAELDELARYCERRALLPLLWPCRLAAADMIIRTGDGANDRATHMAQRSASGPWTDAPRRRHAARVTMNVIARRSDPLGRRLIGVSMPPLGFRPVR